MAPEDTDALGHSWSEWAITEEATCTEAGSKERECSVCHEKETAAIEAAGHSEEEIPAVAATCTEGGKTAGTKCSVCGEILVAPEDTDALGHSWSEWTTITAATFNTDGLKEKVCTVCGVTITETIPAFAPSDAIDGGTFAGNLTWYVTENESDVILTISGVGGIPDYEVQNPPWTNYKNIITSINIEDGVTTIGKYAFFIMKKVTEVTIPNSVTSIREGAFSSCSLINITIPDSINSIGNYAFSDNSNLESITIPDSVVYIGTEAFYNCGSLKDVYYYGSQVSWQGIQIETGNTCLTSATLHCVCKPNEHSWNENYTVDKPASCVEEGLESIHCSVCDMIQDGSTREIPKVEHSYGDWIITEEATCITDGSKEKVCSVCGDKVIETIIAQGHKFNEEFTIDKEPSCIEEGSKSKHCAKCDERTEVTSIPKVAHSYSDWSITKEATCTTDGSKKKECSVCGDTITETLPALGHEFETEFRTDRDPTCTEGGLESRHCIRCDETTDTRAIPANGHSFSDWEEIAQSTCVDHGIEQRRCNVCGVTETNELDLTDHDWEDEPRVDVEPTCTEDGSQSRHCRNCEAVIDSKSIPALGHQYSDWTVVKAVTCTEAGSKEKICALCEDKIIEEIPSLGHDWNNEPTVDKAVTCTSDGFESIHCSRCGEIEEGSSHVIPATGHSYSAWATTIAATEANAGQQSRTCSKCGATETQTIAQLAPTLPSVKISKPKAAKKKITVKWKKVSKKNQKLISGIEIQVATDPGFTNIVRTATAGKKKTSKAIKGLTPKTTYYVRVRAYSGDHRSAWSGVKSGKAK